MSSSKIAFGSNRGKHLVIEDLLTFSEAVGLGLVRNARNAHIIGHNDSVSANLLTLWQDSGVAYVYPSSPTIIIFSSDDDSDSAVIKVTGLDSDWLIQTEEKTLNGRTGVNSANTFIRVLEIEYLSGTRNGTVYVGTGALTTGKPAVVLALLEDEFNVSLQATYSIPGDETGFVTMVDYSSSVNLKVELITLKREFGKLFKPINKEHATDGEITHNFSVIERCLSKSDLEVRSSASGGGGSVAANLCLILIKNEELAI